MSKFGPSGFLNTQEQKQVFNDLGDAGYQGTLNDRMYKKFTDDGHTGILEEKVSKALEAQFGQGNKSGNIRAWKAGGRALDWATKAAPAFSFAAEAGKGAFNVTSLSIDLTTELSGAYELQEGDLVVVTAGVYRFNGGQGLTLLWNGTDTPANLSSQIRGSDTGGGNILTQVAWEVMGATPKTNITMNITGTDIGTVMQVYVFPSGVMDVSPVSATGGNSSNVDCPSITPVTDGAKLFHVGFSADRSGNGTWSGFTGTLNRRNTDGGAARCTMASYYQDQETAAAFDEPAWLYSNNNTANAWVGWSIALSGGA